MAILSRIFRQFITISGLPKFLEDVITIKPPLTLVLRLL